MTESLSKKKLKQAEEVMSNEDLLLQVLLKLPAKSLIRFKSVSRCWLSLISDPKFCSKHTRLNPTSSTLGIYFHYNHKYSSELKSVSLHRAYQEDLPTLTFIKTAFLILHSDPPAIMHACNGLFLCHYTNGPKFVCNVATQTFTILPQHLQPSCDWYRGGHSAYLVFDPSKSPQFKVVLLRVSMRTPNTILFDDDDYKETTAYYTGICYEINVYSSEAGVWERKYFRASHGPHIRYKAVCNGSLHWITKRNYHFQFEVESWKLKYNALALPTPGVVEAEKICYFGECCGRLFLTHIRFRRANSFNVLGLYKNENSWTVKYRVNLHPFIAAFRDSFRFSDPRGSAVMNWNFSVLCVVKENETGDFALLLTIPGKVISYNLISHTFRVLHELPMQEFPIVNDYNFAHTFPLMATLSPV